MVYVSESVIYKRLSMTKDYDLPNVSMEVGLGKERKTIVNIFYREWTGGISKEKSHLSQIGRLKRQIEYWQSLYLLDKDVICMGDANLCALSWNNDWYDGNNKEALNISKWLGVSHFKLLVRGLF